MRAKRGQSASTAIPGLPGPHGFCPFVHVKLLENARKASSCARPCLADCGASVRTSFRRCSGRRKNKQRSYEYRGDEDVDTARHALAVGRSWPTSLSTAAEYIFALQYIANVKLPRN